MSGEFFQRSAVFDEGLGASRDCGLQQGTCGVDLAAHEMHLGLVEFRLADPVLVGREIEYACRRFHDVQVGSTIEKSDDLTRPLLVVGVSRCCRDRIFESGALGHDR